MVNVVFFFCFKLCGTGVIGLVIVRKVCLLFQQALTAQNVLLQMVERTIKELSPCFKSLVFHSKFSSLLVKALSTQLQSSLPTLTEDNSNALA